MAREKSDRSDAVETSPLGRRAYLKAVGATAASLTAAGVASGTASAAKYRTITVPANQTKVISLSDGDTLENVLIDQSAPGAAGMINCVTTGASTTTIRNVGFKGKPGGSFKQFQVAAQARSTAGKIVIDNVYLGDKGPDNYYVGGIYVHNRHRGDVLINNANIQYFGNNGVYGADPGFIGSQHTHGMGTVRIEDSFAKSNNISNFRIGTPGSYVKNSVAHADGNAPPAGSAYNERGVWCEFYTTTVEDSDVTVESGVATSGAVVTSTPSSSGNSPASATVTNCRIEGALTGDVTQNGVTGSPSTTPPAGVPTSATAAASGASSATATTDSTATTSSASTNTLPKVVSIVGNGTKTDYSFTVSGSLEKSTARNASIDAEDVVSGATATGTVHGGTDSYRFSGDVTTFSVTGDATVYVDGTKVDPSTLGSASTSSSSSRTLRIVGTGGKADYAFVVDGTLAHSDVGGGTVQDGDIVHGGTGWGSVWTTGTDSYEFTGSITGFQLSGNAKVFVDGSQVDPSNLGSGPLLPNKLVIDGQSAGPSTYSFSVDTKAVKDAGDGSVNADDVVDASENVTGQVEGGVDAYWFAGNLTDFTLTGDATVTLQYGV